MPNTQANSVVLRPNEHASHYRLRWLGSVVVGRRTCDREVAGSTPAEALFGQQPWASCSHLMCLCSPSSITWYLARAFMLKRRTVAAA